MALTLEEQRATLLHKDDTTPHVTQADKDRWDESAAGEYAPDDASFVTLDDETTDLENSTRHRDITGDDLHEPKTHTHSHGDLDDLLVDDHTQYLLIAGTRAMTGDLNMGTKAITNVGNVDGVDVSAFKSLYDAHVIDTSDPHGASMTISTQLTCPKIYNIGDITLSAYNASADTTVEVVNTSGYVAHLKLTDGDLSILAGKKLAFEHSKQSYFKYDQFSSQVDMYVVTTLAHIWDSTGDSLAGRHLGVNTGNRLVLNGSTTTSLKYDSSDVEIEFYVNSASVVRMTIDSNADLWVGRDIYATRYLRLDTGALLILNSEDGANYSGIKEQNISGEDCIAFYINGARKGYLSPTTGWQT